MFKLLQYPRDTKSNVYNKCSRTHLNAFIHLGEITPALFKTYFYTDHFFLLFKFFLHSVERFKLNIQAKEI